jgi:site-specific DNA-methyltransferase (adenine-specific)
MLNQIIHGDCLEVMKDIPDKSIDMILCDLPYGTTACKWDVIIPFDRLWEQYKRVVKHNAAIVLTASQPFTSQLVMSNLEWFKYSWVWNKEVSGGFATAKYRPLQVTEDICVFAKDKINYFPIMEDAKVKNIRPINAGSSQSKTMNKMGNGAKSKHDYNPNKRFPRNLISYSKYNAECNQLNRLHPTQKPVALFEYLIKTYTNEGDLVLDNCAGSGTTAVAAINTNRNYICIEKEKEYFDIACDRISQPREYSESELETMELKQPEFKQLSLFDVA